MALRGQPGEIQHNPFHSPGKETAHGVGGGEVKGALLTPYLKRHNLLWDATAISKLRPTFSRPLRHMPRRRRHYHLPQRQQPNLHLNGTFCRKICIKPSST